MYGYNKRNILYGLWISSTEETSLLCKLCFLRLNVNFDKEFGSCAKYHLPVALEIENYGTKKLKWLHIDVNLLWMKIEFTYPCGGRNKYMTSLNNAFIMKLLNWNSFDCLDTHQEILNRGKERQIGLLVFWTQHHVVKNGAFLATNKWKWKLK